MTEPEIIVIDDHESVRKSLRALLESAGYYVTDYASAVCFLESGPRGDCLLVDIRMPRMNGIELQEELVKRGIKIPVIVVTGHADVPLAVRAMRAGASDFLEKPFDDEDLLASINRALADGQRHQIQHEKVQSARELLNALSGRERQVFDLLVLGNSNKQIGYELCISSRTVEVHRASLQRKLKARDLASLVRTAQLANLFGQAST